MEQRNCIKYESLEKHYTDIKYSKVQTIIDSNPVIGKHFTNIIKTNNDVELASKAYLKTKDEKLFNWLPYNVKETLFFKDPFYYALEDYFSLEELRELFKTVLEKSKGVGFKEFIVRIFDIKGIDIQTLNLLIRNTELKEFPALLSSSGTNGFSREGVSESLEHRTKIHLMDLGLVPKEREYTYFGAKFSYNFFDSFSRDEVVKYFGEDLENSGYSLYLNHIMTKEERCKTALRNNTFLRFHLDSLPYSFLRMYKGKKEFKAIVGDCRNRDNKCFAIRLAEKLNLSNSLDFLLGD